MARISTSMAALISRRNRKAIFNAGLVPNIKENPTNLGRLGSVKRKRLSFSNGWTHPRGQQSIEALDLVFGALEHAGRRRRQAAQDHSGPTGNGYRSSTRRTASIPSIRTCLATRSKLTCRVGSKNCPPESYSERQLEELDRLIGPWLDDYARTSRAAKEEPRTRHFRES